MQWVSGDFQPNISTRIHSLKKAEPLRLTLLSFHPLGLQHANVEPLLRVLVTDVLACCQDLQRVPRCLNVTDWSHSPLVLYHGRGQPGRDRLGSWTYHYSNQGRQLKLMDADSLDLEIMQDGKLRHKLVLISYSAE